LARRIALGIALALAAAPSAIAQRGTVTERFTAKVQSAIVDSEGEERVEVGDLRSRRLGRGSVLLRIKEGAPTRMTILTDHGAIRATTRIKLEQQPDGSFRGTGTGRIRGGSRGYSGARGSFSIRQTVVPGEGTGPPPGTDPNTPPPDGAGPPGGSGTKTRFTLTGKVTHARL
jgi:hypothetical protein